MAERPEAQFPELCNGLVLPVGIHFPVPERGRWGGFFAAVVKFRGRKRFPCDGGQGDDLGNKVEAALVGGNFKGECVFEKCDQVRFGQVARMPSRVSAGMW